MAHQQRAEETRAKILEAAETLFCCGGMDRHQLMPFVARQGNQGLSTITFPENKPCFWN